MSRRIETKFSEWLCGPEHPELLPESIRSFYEKYEKAREEEWHMLKKRRVHTMTKQTWKDLARQIHAEGHETERTELFGGESVVYEWDDFKAIYQNDSVLACSAIFDKTRPEVGWLSYDECGDVLNLQAMSDDDILSLLKEVSGEKQRRDSVRRDALKDKLRQAFNDLSKNFPGTPVRVRIADADSDTAVSKVVRVMDLTFDFDYNSNMKEWGEASQKHRDWFN